MASENLDATLGFIIETLEDLSVNENEPESVGGISKGGVTLFSYADFCKARSLPPPTKDTIRSLTEDQMKVFPNYIVDNTPPMGCGPAARRSRP